MRETVTRYLRYVSQNILGTVGVSAYILVDTFFISIASGADGITALNLVLPVYGLIFAFGAMIGTGGAIRYSVRRAAGDSEGDRYLFRALLYTAILSIPFLLVGWLCPERLLVLLGADARIVEVGTGYTRTFLRFTPLFMWNHVWNAFVRNDGDPTCAMAATLLSSIFNIIMDYVFMFPCGMGLAGAALATAVSPGVGCLICMLHLKRKENHLKLIPGFPDLRYLVNFCSVGVSAFMGELSSAIITLVFNFLILSLAGNIGVAAYGITANAALVGTAVFTGIAQGAQPLFSEYYGYGKREQEKLTLRLALATALLLAAVLFFSVLIFRDPIVAVFNSEGSEELAAYATVGLPMYFSGYFFAGVNLVGTGYLSAITEAGWAFAASILRGLIAIIVCAMVLAALFGMTGVWLAFAAAEFLTTLVLIAALVLTGRRRRDAVR